MKISKIHVRRSVMWGLAGLAVVMLLLTLLTPTVFSDFIDPPEDNCIVESLFYSDGNGALPADIIFDYIYAYCGPGYCRTYRAPTSADYTAGSANYVQNAELPPQWELVSDHCGTYDPPPAPAIWAADVCESYYGGYFSADGNITLDSDIIGEPLYAGPSMDGPWYPIEANGPPWVFTMDQLMAIADWVAATDYTQTWFKVGDGGTSALLSSMVADRIVRIGDWCPPIMGGPAE